MSGLAGQLFKQAGLYEYDKTHSGRASRWADYKIALTKNKIKQANVKRKIAKIENKLLKDYEMAFNNVSASSELQAHLNNIQAGGVVQAVKGFGNKFARGFRAGKDGKKLSGAALKNASFPNKAGRFVGEHRVGLGLGAGGLVAGGAGYKLYNNNVAASENTVTAGLGEAVKKATSAGWNFVKNNKKKTAGILSAGGAAGFAAGRVTASDEMNDIRAFSLASVKNTLKSIGKKAADSAVGQHVAKNGKKYSAIGGAGAGVLGTFGLQKVTSSETAEVADDGKVAAVKEFIAEKYQDATLDKPILEGEGQEVTAMDVFSSITAAEYLDIKTDNQAGFSVSAADAQYLNSISAMEYLILSNEDTAALTQAVDAANELAETAETPEEVEEAIIRQEEAAQANAEAAQVYSEAASNNHNPDADEHAALAEFHADKAAEAQNNSDVLASWYYDSITAAETDYATDFKRQALVNSSLGALNGVGRGGLGGAVAGAASGAVGSAIDPAVERLGAKIRGVKRQDTFGEKFKNQTIGSGAIGVPVGAAAGALMGGAMSKMAPELAGKIGAGKGALIGGIGGALAAPLRGLGYSANNWVGQKAGI